MNQENNEERIREEKNNILNAIFGPFSGISRNIQYGFKTDIEKRNNLIILRCELPGIKKSDITIEFDDGNLNISAQKHSEESLEDSTFIKQEICYGKFARSFYLGDVDKDSIKAKLEDGVLTIEIPELEEKLQKKTITIE